MSASVLCLTCHRLAPSPSGRCATCGAPMGSREPRPHDARARSIRTMPGLDGLVAAQEAAGSYWFIARSDYLRLPELLEAWPMADDPVRRLLAAKLNRGIVFDPDQFPDDVVRIGSRTAFRTGRQAESCVINDPGDTAAIDDPVPVTSPLGALLFGMIQGRALRGVGADGTALTITVESVRGPDAPPVVGAGARAMAGAATHA